MAGRKQSAKQLNNYGDVRSVRLGFIGTGAMARAITKGIRDSGDTEATLVLQNPEAHLAQSLADEVDAQTVPNAADLLDCVDLVILAVKPNVQGAVLRDLAPHFTSDARPAVLSIAAGRSLQTMAGNLAEAPSMPNLLRVMPNVNAQIGHAISALTASAQTPRETVELARTVFESVGQVIELPENQFAAFSSLGACSPAWFFRIVDSLAQAGVKHGLTKDESVMVVTQSMLGSAALLQQAALQGDNPSSLVDRVCSPGGTTVAGLLAAQEMGLEASLVAAVDAAIHRDHELGD